MRVAIFGATGAGKTTLLNNLKERLPEKYDYISESSLICPYFENAYNESRSDFKSNNYKLDLWMLTDRIRTHNIHKNNNNIIYDRSFIDCLVFTEANYRANRLDKMDYDTFISYFNSCILNDENYLLNESPFDVVIYLKVDSDKIIERIKKRNRTSEIEIDFKFWKILNDLYEKSFNSLRNKLNFYVIDVNKDKPNEIADEISNIIINFDKNNK